MIVKATLNLGTDDYPLHPLKDGEEAEVTPQIGKLMVARGHAVEIVKPQPEVVAAPEAVVSQEPVREAESLPVSSAPVAAEKPKNTKK